MEVISRKSAKAIGLIHYFTGKPCHRGHIDRRHVSSWACMSCVRDNVKRVYQALSDEERTQYYRQRKSKVDQWIQNNPDRWSAISKKANKRLVETGYFREYYAVKREQRKRESLEWYRENTEYATERNKAYVAKRREEMLDHVRALGRRAQLRRRAIQRSVFVEDVDPREVFDRGAGVCGICALPVDRDSKWEVDHVVPLARGGEHSYRNVQLAHRVCNRAKGARINGQSADGLDARTPAAYLHAASD